jgi:nesprin-1
VYSENLNDIETQIEKLKKKENQITEKSEKLKQKIEEKYSNQEKLIPTDIPKELTNLEILAEKVRQSIFEMDREYKKARTIRTEYLKGVDEIQQWIQQTEIKIADRTLEPVTFKELLQHLCAEINDVKQKFEIVKVNGNVIKEKSHNNEEKDLIERTVEQLGKQLDQIQFWIVDKKRQVGDTLEAWSRFMNLYQTIIEWATEKRVFISNPLQITTLHESRQKLNEYNNAVKSIKPIVKHLSEMDKELEQIAQITTVGNLKEKLDEVEELKVEIEAVLLERHSLLLETSEEWDQYEKKLKDVRVWIDKTNIALESAHQKKKSIRDQLGLLEKYSADIVVQRTKISLSSEKLQVHFRAGIIGDGQIFNNSESIINDLETLNQTIKLRLKSCEEIINQIDVYQHQVQTLRQKNSTRGTTITSYYVADIFDK